MYSLRNIDKLNLSVVPEKEIQILKLLYTEREKLIKALRLFEASSEAAAFIDKDVYKANSSTNLKTIAAFKKALKEIERKLKEVNIGNQDLK